MEKGFDLVVVSCYVDDGGVSDWNIVRRFLFCGV